MTVAKMSSLLSALPPLPPMPSAEVFWAVLKKFEPPIFVKFALALLLFLVIAQVSAVLFITLLVKFRRILRQ